jgi:hypothetical protein
MRIFPSCIVKLWDAICVRARRTNSSTSWRENSPREENVRSSEYLVYLSPYRRARRDIERSNLYAERLASIPLVGAPWGKWPSRCSVGLDRDSSKPPRSYRTFSSGLAVGTRVHTLASCLDRAESQPLALNTLATWSSSTEWKKSAKSSLTSQRAPTCSAAQSLMETPLLYAKLGRSNLVTDVSLDKMARCA